MGQLFKNSVFGGFKKQEVISYIEKLKADSEAQAASLRETISNFEKSCKQSELDAEEKDQVIAQLEEKIAEFEEKQCKSDAEIAAFHMEATKAHEDMVSAQRQYSELKEYIADIELSAYKRAREVQEESSKKAQQVSDDIIAMRDNVSPVAERAHSQVLRAEEAFGGFKEKISEITREIDGLVSAINAVENRKEQEERELAQNSPLKSLQEILNRVKKSGQFK